MPALHVDAISHGTSACVVVEEEATQDEGTLPHEDDGVASVPPSPMKDAVHTAPTWYPSIGDGTSHNQVVQVMFVHIM